MRIGIYNIFSSFWLLFILLSGGVLTYITCAKNLFSSDLLIIGKFFIGLFILIWSGILFYFLYKFRIVIITKTKIIAIHPFKFQKQKVELNKIKFIKMENFTAFRETVYRRIKFTDINATLEINDLEFENFNSLLSDLNINHNRKKEIDRKQAKSNLSNINLNILMLSLLLLILIFNSVYNNGYHIVILIFKGSIITLLIASTNRKIRYKRLTKS